MTALNVILTAVAVAATLVNIGWSIWFQRRERVERRHQWEQERALAERQFALQGAVLELRPSLLIDYRNEFWSVVEVRNIGRGTCTVREIAVEVRDGGPTYTVYDRDTSPPEDHGPPLPHLLEGGRAAEWHVSRAFIDDRGGLAGEVLIRLDSGEVHRAPVR